MGTKLRLTIFSLLLMLSVSGAFAIDYIGIVGNGCPIGWSPAGIQLTQDGSIFKYEGALSIGEIKFHLVNGDWCDGQWIQSMNPGDTLSLTPSAYQITNGCDVDNKWQINTAGYFTITIDTLAGTIMMEEAEEPASAYTSIQTAMYAPGSFNSWNASAAIMTLIADYTWETDPIAFEAGDYEMKFANTADWSGDDWGNTTGLTGTVELATGGAPNLTFAIVTAGDYVITFNDETLGYSIATEEANSVNEMEVSPIHIYPNPVSDKLCVNSSKIINNISIRDLSGRTVMNTYVGEKEAGIETSSLESGIYLIHVETIDRASVVQKLVIRN